MKTKIINFIFLFAVLLLVERLSYSIDPLWKYYYGLFSGIILKAGYDLFFNELLRDEYETFK